MSSKYSRLDRFISKKLLIKRGNIRLLLAQQRVQVDGLNAADAAQRIGPFNQVIVDNIVLQEQLPFYIMLHKPVGVVCATTDPHHRTVLDLIDNSAYPNLHIAGRLDLNTSGLVLLTNDGKWSKGLCEPKSNIDKTYQVELEHNLNSDYVSAFAEGMYFSYEDLTTEPAHLEIMTDTTALVKLTQGRYHQIKRMFGRFRNPVKSLHRFAIGSLILCEDLKPGEYRPLNDTELAQLNVQIKQAR
ncbi:MAG: pseudouridine synthase [Oceanospirillaceae bacterium]|nr:pseudouridine synthase [Oceanospirillaceae bacterium]